MTSRNEIRTLVTLGDYYGSIAAARDLGKNGVEVFFADHRAVVPGKWSRFVTERVVSPSPDNLTEYGNWLLEFGQSNKGQFLYPTSDDLAWILSSRRDELSKYYSMYQPSLECIYSLLNKRQLFEMCDGLDISAPLTHFPESLDKVRELATGLSYPVLIKPKTQMGFRSKNKGLICNSREELVEKYAEYQKSNLYDNEVVSHDPNVVWPMLQAYHEDAMQNTYSIAGFIDKSGEIKLFRASQKVLQKPRRMGVGLCFEGRKVNAALSDSVCKIVEKSGYYGVFECEFIYKQTEDQYLLMDFNPRYYGQMAFEIARNLPLPRLALYGALSNEDELRRLASQSTNYVEDERRQIYGQFWYLLLLTTTQMIGLRMSPLEAWKWLRWRLSSGNQYFDAIDYKGDLIPKLLDISNQLIYAFRHPRDFVKKFFLEN